MRKTINLLLLCFFIVVGALSSCSKDEDEPIKVITNNLIGTWKWQDPTDYYWYEIQFNENLTGIRTDADGEEDVFTYTFTETEINFTTGFPNGKYDYSVYDSNTKLSLFGDVLQKQ